MKLYELIFTLQSKNFKINSRLKNIDKVIEKLKELESMIGMQDVKDSFTSQILLILLMKKHGYNLPFKKMHTIISGPPGVGKTTLSILIAEIWSLLDVMDRRMPSVPVLPFLKEKGKTEEDNIELRDVFSSISPGAPHLSPSLTDPVEPCCAAAENDHSDEGELLLEEKREIITLITSILDNLSEAMIAMDKAHRDSPPEEVPQLIKDIYSHIQDSMETCQELLQRSAASTKKNDKLDFDCIKEEESACCLAGASKENIPYIVLGREDFVGTYQGHTSIKTKEILDANRGKIIIIEEAYLLSTDERDSYGMEALTLINRYMDEKTNDYIFVFNGYTDHLDRTIFRVQPGLKRRIQLVFRICKYSGEEIYQIFRSQLEKDGYWHIQSKDEPLLKNFFIKNCKKFPHFGGSTERLILLSKMAYAELHAESKGDLGASRFPITHSILEKAFTQYLKTMDEDNCDAPPFGIYT